MATRLLASDTELWVSIQMAAHLSFERLWINEVVSRVTTPPLAFVGGHGDWLGRDPKAFFRNRNCKVSVVML